MKRAVTIATLACSILFVEAINTSEARPPVWRQVQRQSRQLNRNVRQATQDLRRFDRQLSNNFNRYKRRYNNFYYRGSRSQFQGPGFSTYYGW